MHLGKRQNGRKLIEKSGLSHVRSFVIVIRSAYFGAQKRRKYEKSIGVNMSGIGAGPSELGKSAREIRKLGKVEMCLKP